MLLWSAPTHRDQLTLTALPSDPSQKGDLYRWVAPSQPGFKQDPKQ